MEMLKTDSEYEKIVNLDCIGIFDTPNGTMKVLVLTVRVARSDLDQRRDVVKASAQPAPAPHDEFKDCNDCKRLMVRPQCAIVCEDERCGF